MMINSNRCLFCYQSLEPGQIDFHPKCSRKIFHQSEPPEVPYSEETMEALAKKILRQQVALTGVQPKLSLSISKGRKKRTPRKMTIVGLWGPYILKPPTKHYPYLPELEDLTMHLAERCRISTVPHTLIRLKSGTLAYLTKRIDRVKGDPIHMEDMCQLSGRLTEHKYHGSHEQIAKIIKRHSVHPGLDLVNYFELVLFSFITGNADMHLKNFSLINQPEIGWILAPAYDLVPTALVVSEDPDELALTLRGKKRNLTRKHFEMVMADYDIDQKATANIFSKFSRAWTGWQEWIETAFIPDALKKDYTKLIKSRLERFGLR